MYLTAFILISFSTNRGSNVHAHAASLHSLLNLAGERGKAGTGQGGAPEQGVSFGFSAETATPLPAEKAGDSAAPTEVRSEGDGRRIV